jgi:predicted ester cyclase
METRELVVAIADAENERDWARLAELFDEQVTIVHPGIGPVVGRDANISVMQFIIGAIEGYTRTTEGLVVDGDRGAFRFAISGKHVGDLPGYPATGDAVDISGAMFFRVFGERLVEATELLNHDSTRNLSLR